MSILSFDFLFFVAAVVLVYYLLPLKIRWYALLLASGVFACLSGWQGAAHLGAVGLITWLGALALRGCRDKEAAALEAAQAAEKASDGAQDTAPEAEASAEAARQRKIAVRWARWRRVLLFLLLLADFSAMLLVKYYPAVASWLNGFLDKKAALPLWDLAAPLGLSYYTFQTAGYLIDVSRGKADAPKNPCKAQLFAGYFLQLPQGPISSWKELAGSLTEGHRLEPENLTMGFQLMAWGYFKKLLIADRLADTTLALLGAQEAQPGWFVLGCALLYALRLYADFSGGMDVVRGISLMLGIPLPENFRRPFFSQSVAEYWRRWHITLGAWFRTYLLYPFAASRAGVALGRGAGKILGKKTGRALPAALMTVVVFLLIGLWHIANGNAVAFGLYFGVLMALSMLLDPVWKTVNRTLRLPKGGWMTPVRLVRTWALVLFAQYFAFTSSPQQGLDLIRQTFSPWDLTGFIEKWTGVMPEIEWIIVGAGLVILLIVDLLTEKKKRVNQWLAGTHVFLRWPLLLLLILAVLIFGRYGHGYDQAGFLYTQF